MRLIRTLSTLGGYLAGALLVATTLLITTEILLRSLFGRSTQVAEEYSGYLLAAMIYVGAAYTLAHKEHIRVEILRERLGARGRVWLERFALAVGLAFASLLLYAFFGLFADSLSHGSRSFMPSRTLMAVPHGAIFVGAALLWLQFLGLLLESWLPNAPDIPPDTPPSTPAEA